MHEHIYLFIYMRKGEIFKIKGEISDKTDRQIDRPLSCPYPPLPPPEALTGIHELLQRREVLLDARGHHGEGHDEGQVEVANHRAAQHPAD